MIDPKTIAELQENHWYFHDSGLVPSPRSIMEHMKLISAADLSHLIILDQGGRVMDGMHRICRAILGQIVEVSAVQFVNDPDPDFVNFKPEDLVYDA